MGLFRIQERRQNSVDSRGVARWPYDECDVARTPCSPSDLSTPNEGRRVVFYLLSNSVDATSLPGSCGALWATTTTQSIALLPRSLVLT